MFVGGVGDTGDDVPPVLVLTAAAFGTANKRQRLTGVSAAAALRRSRLRSLRRLLRGTTTTTTTNTLHATRSTICVEKQSLRPVVRTGSVTLFVSNPYFSNLNKLEVVFY